MKGGACKKAAAALLGLCLCLPAVADERILEFRSEIAIQPDGGLVVTEILRVRSEGKQIQRGIYRDFPTRYRDRFGNFVNVEFSPLSVTRNGAPERWHSRDRDNGVRLYAGSKDSPLEPGIHVYQLTYLTNRQLGYFENHDELYFNVVGTGWAFPIDSAVALVTPPFAVDAGLLSLHSYTGHSGSKESNATAEVLNDGRIRFEATRALQPGEAMTIAVGWPKGLVQEPSAGRRVIWFLADNGAALVLLLCLLAMAAWYGWAWHRVGRDPQRGVIIPRFEPPGGLSPAASRYVESMSFNRHVFSAAVISLAVKGRIRIEENDGEFTLRRTAADPGPLLSPGESALLETLLPGPGQHLAMKQENHRDFQAAQRALKKALKKEYEGRLFHLNLVYIVPAAFLTLIAVVAAFLLGASAFACIVFGLFAVGLNALFIYLLRAPTRSGRQVMDQIEGFRMYLDTGERDRLERMRSPSLTPEVFESFLPYAYALGVENSWCERFAREVPEAARQDSGYQPGWYSGPHRGVRTLGHLGNRFGQTFSSAIASASAAPGSRSGSGGGGSAGGGGGGGGGGGW